MDHFRMQISALYAEYLLELPDFLDARQQLVRAAMSRRPWESECFLGEHNLASFIRRTSRRIFGHGAAPVYGGLIACFLESLSIQARGSDFILFVPLISCPWIVAIAIGVSIYHFQYDVDENVDFEPTWRPATHDWYNVTEYGPQMDLQHPIGDESPLVDDNLDADIERTRARHTKYFYYFLVIWLMMNLSLLVPQNPKLLGIAFICIARVALFLLYQIVTMYLSGLYLGFDSSSEYFY